MLEGSVVAEIGLVRAALALGALAVVAVIAEYRLRAGRRREAELKLRLQEATVELEQANALARRSGA
jgi:hypothetical protein